MRTTLDIDDDLMREAKRRAAERGETLTRVMEQALRESFRKEQAIRDTAFRFKWVTVRGSIQPGVDLTDRDALYEHMEGRR